MKNEMAKIFLLRILSSVIILFLVISFVFVLIHSAPGNPAQKFISPTLNQKLFEEVRDTYKLQDSLIDQYLVFLKNSISGDFGISFNYRKPVINVISKYFTFTMLFGITAFFFQILISFLMVYMSIKIGRSWFQKLLANINLTIYSVPIFVSGILLVYIFSFQLNILPSSGLKSFDVGDENILWIIMDYSRHLILPVIASSFTAIPIYYKYLFGAIQDIRKTNYIKNLELLGFSKKTILFKNIIPNSLGSLISVAGVELGILLGGSVIVETIFGLPGMGRLTLSAVITRDYPLIVGAVLISSSIILLINLLADILKIFIDKRLLKNVLS
jgi:peptide/nickel transport system permease protein